jgi:hypothetical protein
MHKNNEEKSRYCRIPQCWDQGIDGSGGPKGRPIKVAIAEDIVDDDHGHKCADIVRQVAPGAIVIGRPRPTMRVSGGHLTPESRDALEAYYRGLVSEGVDILSLSIGGGAAPEVEALDREILDPGRVTRIAAAGNDYGKIDKSSFAYLPTWAAIGAAILIHGKPAKKGYSETGPQLAAMGFTGLTTTDGLSCNGTSFSGPWVVGELALRRDWFFRVNGRMPTQEEDLAWLQDNAEDMGVPGRDDETGAGLVRMPVDMSIPEIPEQDNPPEPESPEPGQRADFPDVPASEWSHSIIHEAARRGLMMGDTEGMFRPDSPVTREELAVVALRLDDRIKEVVDKVFEEFLKRQRLM